MLATVGSGGDEVGSLLRGAAEDAHAVAKTLKKACLFNSAAAALGAENWSKAIEAASLVLEEDPGNAKALFRRGLARAGEAKKEKSGRNEALTAAADFRAAAEAAKGTADEPTIREKFSEVEASLTGGSSDAA